MRGGSDTKKRMVEAALQLFHEQGVNATSIDQVLNRSETGKGQFTYYFKTKDGLVREVIAYLNDIIRNGKAPTGYELKTWEDFEGWFQKYIDFQHSVSCTHSCPLGTIGNDLTSEQELIRQDVRIFLEWCRNKFVRFFAERKAAGELIEAAHPDQLADLCISVMQGGMLLTKVRRESEMFENASNAVINYVRMLRASTG